MKDWPDPRVPDIKISRFEIVFVSALTIIPILIYFWPA
jgi:hypothetical protein